MPNDFASVFGAVPVTDAAKEYVLEAEEQAQLDADIATKQREAAYQHIRTTAGGDPLYHTPGRGGRGNPVQHLATKSKGQTRFGGTSRRKVADVAVAAAAAAAPSDEEKTEDGFLKDAITSVEKKRRSLSDLDDSDEESTDQRKPAAKQSKVAPSIFTRKGQKKQQQGPVFQDVTDVIGQMSRSDCRGGPRVGETVEEKDSGSDDDNGDYGHEDVKLADEGAEVIDLIEETWNANIDPKTREGYQGLNKLFVLWIYDQYQEAEADSILQKEYKGLLHTECLDAFQKITAKKDAVEQDTEHSKTAKAKELKGLGVELSAVALSLVKKASKDFHPVSNLATI